MKISELTNAPQWLLDANTADADVEIISGRIVWHDGIWHDGIWHDGIWHDGIWYDGTWRGGTWRGGTWYDGIWHDGIWHDGIWRSGVWVDGAQHGGSFSIHSKYLPTINYNGTITIGCKTKSIAEWDTWFAGDEEFDTPRNTDAFKKIYAHYCATKAYKEVTTC